MELKTEFEKASKQHYFLLAKTSSYVEQKFKFTFQFTFCNFKSVAYYLRTSVEESSLIVLQKN
jgi:hypothetical protein